MGADVGRELEALHERNEVRTIRLQDAAAAATKIDALAQPKGPEPLIYCVIAG